MTEIVASGGPVVAVFASDRGPGDPERASLMSQAGAHFARRGARIVCMPDAGGLSIPVITGARSAGGDAMIVASSDFAVPSALSGVRIERFATEEERLRHLVGTTQVLVGLPGSLASAAALFAAWAKAREIGMRRPVVLVNRNRAFEAMRGFFVDVIAHDVKHADKLVQFTDSIEDAWTRISRLAA